MAGKIGIKAEEKKKLWMKTLNELKKLLAEHMEILEDRYKELQRRPQGVQFIKIQKVMEKESSK
jgi:inorganic pyrophosphatase